MIPLNKRTSAFISLGNILCEAKKGTMLYEYFDTAVKTACADNPWFIYHEVWDSLRNIGRMLNEVELVAWVSQYRQLLLNLSSPRHIAVIMAGNIPAVGFHDMLCVLMAGHHFFGKMAAGDKHLLPAIARMLMAIEPDFKKIITFQTTIPIKPDLVIATGSNNSYRYFKYLFGSLPHIFRKNRNSVAIVTGGETQTELAALGNDIFTYCGLGCRNVSSLYLTTNIDLDWLLLNFNNFSHIIDHKPYQNSYRFQKAMLKMNNTEFTDNGYLLMVQSEQLASPVGVLHYLTFQSPANLRSHIQNCKEQIQCIVSGHQARGTYSVVPFGMAQQPSLSDYADEIDTMEFLLS